MKHAQCIFFIGKGGVGKTTCSVATAVNLSDQGHKVLLVSLDPAHNAGDALHVALSDAKTSITPTLDAMEIDLENLIKRYLRQTSASMQHTYRHLTVFNLEKLLDVIRYSPGIEEHATFEALKEIIANEAEHYDAIIFDTAPTGLTLRVLALPSVSMVWIDKLSQIRKKILSRRSAIENVHGERVMKIDGVEERLASNEAEDNTMQELHRSQAETRAIQNILTDPKRTSVVAVLNAEDMPLLETQRAAEALKQFKIPLKLLIINKVLEFQQVPPEFECKLAMQAEMITKIQHAFPGQTITKALWQQEEPCGLEKLRGFSKAPAEFFQTLL